MQKKTINILQKFFKKSAIFRYAFTFNSAYKRSTGKVYYVSDDLQTVRVKIPLSYRNRNYVGTLFGGAMTSATDPIYMIQLISILGDEYVVWDKAASIQFKRPGNQTLYAEFHVSDALIETIKADINAHNEATYTLRVDLTDKKGVVYAEIERTIYIASKAYYKSKKLKQKSSEHNV